MPSYWSAYNFTNMSTPSQSLLITLVSFTKQLINPLYANPTKWSNTLKQFIGNLPTNCLSVFDHFVKLTLKGLKEKLPLAACVNYS